MILKTVFVRFYKSFNYDYLRKFHPSAKRRDWEGLGGGSLWYPYVAVSLDPHVTTIVGANESGKSHLLSAIEKGITGEGIERSDFCRYSQFFAVERDKMRWPDFGLEWTDLDEEDAKSLAEACELPRSAHKVKQFIVFRNERSSFEVFIPDGDGFVKCEVKEPAKLQALFPATFRIDADIGLPENVPIRFLAGLDNPHKLDQVGRRRRFQLAEGLYDGAGWFESAESITKAAAAIAAKFKFFSQATDISDEQVKGETRRNKELELARKLICGIAKVDPQALRELYDALRDEKDAYVNGIIQEINNALDVALNFPRWWVQDRDFHLMVSPREFDLVFTIRDRTGTEYSFGERSSGLKYFLSYYIQYLGYQPEGRTPEILLMDEPDAYLSSQGQQDLLKLFDAFAHPEGSRPPVQVVYVTHSPFLIDKNHAERIRVLEKGVSDEGTRVVRDVSKNHYEPLRSAFGAFVGETTFIGNCNLVVEGPADQMLLAGAAALLRAEGTGERETLDLNHITIVPAGSASHVPYIVYLARGRDIVKPAVIVLLDSDKEGNKAVKDLRRGGARQQVILDSKLILQVGDLEEIDLADNQHLLETEDLVPLSICVEAVSVYFAEVYGVDENAVQEITADSISKHLNENTSVFKAIEAELAGLEEPLHIEKMGFARAVLSVVNRRIVSANDQDKDPDALAFLQNMRVLFAALTLRQRQAERDTKVDRVSQKIERLKSAFANDHSTSASREQVLLLFEEVDAVLDSSDESNAIRLIVHQIKQEYQIEEDVTEPVARYDDFLQRLDHLRYAGRLATQEPEPAQEVDDPSVVLDSKPTGNNEQKKRPEAATVENTE